MKKKVVLYIHSAGPFGGSSRSLFEMLKAADLAEYELNFLTQKGEVEGYFKKLGRVIAVRGISQFDHGRYSYYRGIRWLILLREFFHLPFLIWGLFRCRALLGRVDIIHVNDFVGLPGIILASLFFRCKKVLHIRSLVNSDKKLLRTRLVGYLIEKTADAVICIDETVRRTIDLKMDVEIIHNGLNVGPRREVNAVYSERDAPLRVGFVGNLLLQKGILDLIEAAAQLRGRGIYCEFFIYGHAFGAKKGIISSVLELAGIKQDVRAKVLSLVKNHSLEDCFKFMGFTNNLEAAYQSFDVLCFPSHLDAPGRPVLEAAYFSRPSIVAVENPTSDTIVPNVTGLTFEPRSIVALVAAIEAFHEDRSLLKRMGEAAKMLSDKKYNQVKNSIRVFELYESLISSKG